MIKAVAYARFGLIGNPSDGYFGKTISAILKNFRAKVTLFESPRLQFIAKGSDELEYDSIDSLAEDIRIKGYYGGIRLLKASTKKFYDYCNKNGIELPAKNFSIEYDTNIPVRVGLAGSSGIITATMRALCQFYNVQIPKPVLPSLILKVELEELGIGAGLQDRVIQVYEGSVFMDFEEEHLRKTGHGHYREIDPKLLPPLFVAYNSDLAEGTELTHNNLRVRYNQGDPDVVEGMKNFAQLAQESYDLIISGKGTEIGPLLDQNFDLRKSLCSLNPSHVKLIEMGRKHSCPVKYAGSGGAIVGVYDGSQSKLEELQNSFKTIGAEVVAPIF